MYTKQFNRFWNQECEPLTWLFSRSENYTVHWYGHWISGKTHIKVWIVCLFRCKGVVWRLWKPWSFYSYFHTFFLWRWNTILNPNWTTTKTTYSLMHRWGIITIGCIEHLPAATWRWGLIMHNTQVTFSLNLLLLLHLHLHLSLLNNHLTFPFNFTSFSRGVTSLSSALPIARLCGQILG